MHKEFIFEIGEAIMMDLEQVKQVTYPQNEMYPQTLYIETIEGEKFELTMKEKL